MRHPAGKIHRTDAANLMRKSLILACVLGFTALTAPIAVALYWASREALNAEMAYAGSVADELLRRSVAARQQIYLALDALGRAPRGDCSEPTLSLMRELNMGLSYLKDVGAVRDGRLICSSMGRYRQGIPLGPSDARVSSGVQIWRDVVLPYAPGLHLNLFEHKGWVVALHPDFVFDLALRDQDTTVAVLIGAPPMVLQSRGPIDAARLTREPSSASGPLELPDHLLVFRHSPENNLTTMVAISRVGLHARMGRQALILLPLAAIAGLLLVAAVALATRQRLSLPGEIRLGLKRREFHLHYQPVVDLQTGRCVGAEALLRWRRPAGAPMSPDLFIPAAERSGLIRAITAYVIDIAARDLPVLLAQQQGFHLGINFSAQDLETEGSITHLLQRLREIQAPPGSLVVEITERNVTDARAAGKQIARLHDRGVQVAVDDFGTGHSSLSVLAGLELDILKIDKSFVDAIDAQAAASLVLPHIIDMAKTLRLFMIAEGVETETQADYLRERGVQFAQGWLYGKPMPLDDLLDLLRTQGRAWASRGHGLPV
ncbi:EAL domain-containing protein [Hylemonella gracilis]|uniref:cyclic-guanylate-specific phosphodiesterase n=2 Tax=Hylemonella gracilis TaxID=80880 RepID=A0A4V1A2C1_9BURK|nr:EAL domain-containing protein [Hylemonella gracilis]